MAKRTIFQDVSEGSAAPPPPQGGMISARQGRSRRPVLIWLILIFAMVAAMILLGGLTRLSGAGLSITEWRPISGALPPMNDADWQAEFLNYQQSPQFKLMNSHMDLVGFKTIFWWEWAHRLLGRLIGLVWGVGFAILALTRHVPPGWSRRFFLLGALGGLQGAVGWWMVASGLTGDMTAVASYRLAIHLGMGFAILGLIVWYVQSLSRSGAQLLQARRGREEGLYRLSAWLSAGIFVQVLLGALVAGIDAGRAFPTWPLMNGSFFPADAFYVPDGGATWRAFFENPGLVQFIHRMMAYLLLAYGAYVVLQGRRSPHETTRGALTALGVALLAQAVLGILTALHAAPLGLAIAHQAGAILTFSLALRATHRALYPIATAIRDQK